MAGTPPPYAPNVVNQTVDYGGYTWKGQPGGSWTMQSVSGGGGGGTSTSTGALDTSALTDVLTKAAATQSDFLARFRAAIAGTPATDTTAAVPGMAERIQNELGIPALSKAAADVATNVTNMPYTQGAATRGYDVNADQLQRIINQKQSELAPTATAIANQLGAVTPLATQQLQTEILPWTTEATMVSDAASREVTGYTSIMQAQLDTLLEKMKEGSALTLQESKQAADLAAKEQDFVNTSKTNSQQVVEVGGRKVLYTYDNQGNIVSKQDLGSATSGTGTGNVSTYLTTSAQTDWATTLNSLFSL